MSIVRFTRTVARMRFRLTPRESFTVIGKIRMIQSNGSKANAHLLAAELIGVDAAAIDGNDLFHKIRVQGKMFNCVYCKVWKNVKEETKTDDEVCIDCKLKVSEHGGES